MVLLGEPARRSNMDFAAPLVDPLFDLIVCSLEQMKPTVKIVDIAISVCLEGPAKAVAVFGQPKPVLELLSILQYHPVEQQVVVQGEDRIELREKLDASRDFIRDIVTMFRMRHPDRVNERTAKFVSF